MMEIMVDGMESASESKNVSTVGDPDAAAALG